MAGFDFTGPSKRSGGFNFAGPSKRTQPASLKEANAVVQDTGLNKLAAAAYKTAASGLGMAGQVLDTPRRAVSGAIGGTIDNGGNVVEGLKSAIGDTFHPNDEESINRHVDVQRGSIDPNYYNQIERVNDGTASLGEKASVMATRLGTETAEDPLTYGTMGLGGLVRGGARLAEKLAPGLSESARDFFEGSHELTKLGISGDKKNQFQSIEESEHQKYLDKYKNTNDNVTRHLATDNPVLPPKELEREMGLFDDPHNPGVVGVNTGPKTASAEDLPEQSPEAVAAMAKNKGRDKVKAPGDITVEEYKRQGAEHASNMKQPAYAAAFNAAQKLGKDFRTSMKAGRDTLESQDIHPPKAEESLYTPGGIYKGKPNVPGAQETLAPGEWSDEEAYQNSLPDSDFMNRARVKVGDKTATATAAKQRPLFAGATEQDQASHIANMRNPVYENEYKIQVARKKGKKVAIEAALKKMRENAQENFDKNLSVKEERLSKEPKVESNSPVEHFNQTIATDPTFGLKEPNREPGESDKEFAAKTFDFHLKKDAQLRDFYEKGVKEGMSFQEAAANAYRQKYLREYEQKVVQRAVTTLGIPEEDAKAGIKALSDGDMKKWATISNKIGSFHKATMFINWIPHVFGNVAQNTFLSGGAKTLAKATHYTMHPDAIPPEVLRDMKEAGAAHSGFDKFDPVSEHLQPKGPKRAWQQLKHGYGKATSKVQDLTGSTYMMNHAENGARAASWEDNALKYAKEKGKDVKDLDNEDKLIIGSMVRRDIGDYRNPNKAVKFARDRLGATFPQYRAIALGVAARSAMKNPNRLEGIYRTQDEANKAFNPDGKVNLNLGGVSNAANKAVSTPSEYLRGTSAVGPVLSSALDVLKAPDNIVTGSEPGSNDYGKDSYMQGLTKAAIQNLTPGYDIPGLNELIYDNTIHGENNNQKTAQEKAIDFVRGITGINQKHKMSDKDRIRLENWERNGGDLEDSANAPRKKTFSF